MAEYPSPEEIEWALAIMLHAWEHDARPPVKAIRIADAVAKKMQSRRSDG
jgi:hypothetical protein